MREGVEKKARSIALMQLPAHGRKFEEREGTYSVPKHHHSIQVSAQS